MSYPSYPEYQETDVEWLDQMPSHWTVKRLRHVIDLNPGKSRVRGYDPEMETTFLPMEAVGEDGSLDLTATKPLSDVIDGYTYFQEDDVAYAKITPCFENGKAAILRGLTNGIGFGTTELTVLRPHTDQTTPDYLFRVITSEPFRSLGESSMYGAGGQKRVPDDFARNFSIPWPPLPEQTQIARFLDHQTAHIDALIAEQQRLIELLKEKRQAVISHAVTKGLDPDVAMKDSGVEWLGEVPEHWSVTPLRWYATVQGGLAKGKTYESYVETVELPYLRVANVQDGYVDLSAVHTVVVSTSEAERYKLRAGDVLMNEGGDNDKLGRGTVWEGEIGNCLHQNHVFAIRPNESLSPEWLALFTRSASARAYFYLYSKQSTNLASVSSSNLMSCPLPIPPKSEQSAILDEIRLRTKKIDRLIETAHKSVQLLVERRSALISAAVTGKIDVRDWKPPTSETFPDHAGEEGATA